MESSSRIQSEEPLHPGDVFMMFATDGKVQVTSANGCFFRSFEHFSIHCATALLNQMRPPYGNSFFVHWRFENPASVWAGNENISIYPRRLLQAVRDQGLRPRATRRLYPLLYGIQKGCDTRQMADLYDNLCTTIPTIWNWFASMRVSMSKNVRCRTGVLKPMRAFFSSTAHRVASRFTVIICVFLRIISTIRAWTLPTFARWSCCPTRPFVQRSNETLRSKVNPPVDVLGSGSMEMLGRRPSVYHAEQDQLGIYTELRRFDLSPKEANFIRLSNYIKSRFPGSFHTLIEDKVHVSAERSSQKLQINGNIVHNNNQMHGNGLGRHLPDVAERLSRRSVKKRVLFDNLSLIMESICFGLFHEEDNRIRERSFFV